MRAPNIPTNHGLKECTSGLGYPSSNHITGIFSPLPFVKSVSRSFDETLGYWFLMSSRLSHACVDSIPAGKPSHCLLDYRLFTWNACRKLEGVFQTVTMKKCGLSLLEHVTNMSHTALTKPFQLISSVFSREPVLLSAARNRRAVLTVLPSLNFVPLPFTKTTDFRLDLFFLRRTSFTCLLFFVSVTSPYF